MELFETLWPIHYAEGGKDCIAGIAFRACLCLQGLVILSRNFACIMNVSRKSIVQVCLLLLFYVFFVLGFLASRLSGFLVSLASWLLRLLGFSDVRLLGFLACSLLGFWASWLLLLLGFLPGFLASPGALPALLQPFVLTVQTHVTTMFAVGEACANHFACKWETPPLF